GRRRAALVRGEGGGSRGNQGSAALPAPAGLATGCPERLEHDLDQRVRAEHMLPCERPRSRGAARADGLADRAVLEVVLRVERVELGTGAPDAGADEAASGGS